MGIRKEKVRGGIMAQTTHVGNVSRENNTTHLLFNVLVF